MNRRRAITTSLLLPTVFYNGCLDILSSGNGYPDKVHYVAIDIDDVFLSSNLAVEVKINPGDVIRLVELTKKIGISFGCDFKFSLGFNCGYFDADNEGDRALIEHSGEFTWFNHLPRHEHVREYSLTAQKIENLMIEGEDFENSKGFSQYVSKTYMITPKSNGIWPPYEPLYESFNKFGILYTASSYIKSPHENKGVRIFPRTLIGIGASKHSTAQVSKSGIEILARKLYYIIMANEMTLLAAHQANFTDNRPAAKIIEKLIPMLLEEKDHEFIFLPAGKAIEGHLSQTGHSSK